MANGIRAGSAGVANDCDLSLKSKCIAKIQSLLLRVVMNNARRLFPVRIWHSNDLSEEFLSEAHSTTRCTEYQRKILATCPASLRPGFVCRQQQQLCCA